MPRGCRTGRIAEEEARDSAQAGLRTDDAPTPRSTMSEYA